MSAVLFKPSRRTTSSFLSDEHLLHPPESHQRRDERLSIRRLRTIDIPCEYRYYIENEEDISKNELRSWLYNTFCVSNALANSKSIKDRIILEYVPSGQDYLQPIVEAMKENRVLNITYHSYWKDEENNFDVQPYCVKLFRQRWYKVVRSTYSYY